MKSLLAACIACAIASTQVFALPICGITDFDFDGDSDIDDIVALSEAVKENNPNDIPLFDVNCDGYLTQEDLIAWNDILGYQLGDVNLDGSFDLDDLDIVYSAGEFEDGIPGNSNYLEGDFNGDGDFDSSDIVLAMELL